MTHSKYEILLLGIKTYYLIILLSKSVRSIFMKYREYKSLLGQETILREYLRRKLLKCFEKYTHSKPSPSTLVFSLRPLSKQFQNAFLR